MIDLPYGLTPLLVYYSGVHSLLDYEKGLTHQDDLAVNGQNQVYSTICNTAYNLNSSFIFYR